MTYNGWTNYETWLANIHFENWDFSDYIEDIADTEPEDEGDVRNWIEEYLKQNIWELTFEAPDIELGTWQTDLLQAAYSEIDFRDLAEHYSEEVWDEVEYILSQQKAAEDEGKANPAKDDIPPFADLEKEFGLKPEKSGYQAIIDQGSY